MLIVSGKLPPKVAEPPTKKVQPMNLARTKRGQRAAREGNLLVATEITWPVLAGLVVRLDVDLKLAAQNKLDFYHERIFLYHGNGLAEAQNYNERLVVIAKLAES
jgi:hypothetical protein